MNRFDEMAETHRRYFPIYRSAVENIQVYGETGQMLNHFVIGKIGSKKGIRGYILRKMYELIGGNWEEILPIIAAVEMHLASMYCFNVGADSKSGYDTAEKRKTAFNTRDISFELALAIISQSGLPEEKVRILKDLFIITDQTFYKGETLDVLANIYSIPNITNEDIRNRYGIEPTLGQGTLNEFEHSSLEERVLYRTYGINAAMFENLGTVVGILRNVGGKEIDALTSFGRNYGLAMMIINDVQDYSLDLAREITREKKHLDVFSDLREGKITWPILFYLNREDINSIPWGNCDYQEYEDFRQKLCKTGIIKRCVLEAMAYSKRAVTALSPFANNDSRNMLIDSAVSISKLSKYITLLEERYNVRLVPSKGDVNLRAKEIVTT